MFPTEGEEFIPFNATVEGTTDAPDAVVMLPVEENSLPVTLLSTLDLGRDTEFDVPPWEDSVPEVTAGIDDIDATRTARATPALAAASAVAAAAASFVGVDAPAPIPVIVDRSQSSVKIQKKSEAVLESLYSKQQEQANYTLASKS